MRKRPCHACSAPARRIRDAPTQCLPRTRALRRIPSPVILRSEATKDLFLNVECKM